MSEDIEHYSDDPLGKRRRWGEAGAYPLLALLLPLLLLLDVAAFWFYRRSFPWETFSLQIWNYLGSEAFKIFTVSLILPLVLLALENNFKLAERLMQNQEERLKTEKQASRDQALRNRQDEEARCLEVISQTIKWWNDAYDCSAEIRYFTKPTGDRSAIEDSLKRLYHIVNAADEVLNNLYFTFRDLDPNIFYHLFRVFVLSSETVAVAIRRNDDWQEIEALQNCLGVILEGINQVAYQRIVSILRSSLELKRARSDRNEQEQKFREDEIGGYRSVLVEWANKLREREKRRNKLLCSIEGQKGEDLRTKVQSLECSIKKSPGSKLRERKEFKEMEDSFRAIPTKDRAAALSALYSPQYVEELADFLGFETFIRSRVGLQVND